jgi:hypothetical protein
MTQVSCTIDYIELENDDGRWIDSVRATCSQCEHATESFGRSSRSVRRCLVTMREECPEGQNNHYIAEDGQDDDAY